ncbi:MAG: hypothetical protein L0213_05970, partial [Candidatus Dadabacteria bacterium]|nr:hypothetical protein [Candidatus Dadabacteria bacterium]
GRRTGAGAVQGRSRAETRVGASINAVLTLQIQTILHRAVEGTMSIQAVADTISGDIICICTKLEWAAVYGRFELSRTLRRE